MTILIVLLVSGAALLMAEIFLPGMIAGILGCVCFLAAIVWTWQQFGAQPALILFIIELIGGVILTLLWMKYFPQSPFGRRFSLPTADSQVSAPIRPELVGKTGISLTTLRPAGTARIDGHRVDVVTEGSHLDAGSNITVVKAEGGRIVVRLSSITNPNP